MTSFREKLTSQLAAQEEELKKQLAFASEAAAAAETAVAAAMASETGGVRAAVAVAEPEAQAEVPSLLVPLDSTTYYSQIMGHKGLAVVKWAGKVCGPCKAVLPKVEQMAAEFGPQGVFFGRIWTTAANKALGQGLGVKTAPTFLVYKSGTKVAEVRGNHPEELRQAIEDHK